MLADEFLNARLVDAGEAFDEAIAALANDAGLRVDPKAHRLQAGALLLAFVEETNSVLGFVSARILLDEMEIFDLCVAEQSRRRGIGRALLSELLRRAEAAGVIEIFLEVRVSNTAALALYGSLGFSQVAVRDRYYSDGEDAALFRCCLTPSS